MRILLVEDQQKLARNIQEFLATEGFTVTVCHNGSEALQTAQEGGFDAMILDVNLPGMDGFTICAKLREDKITTPIIMLTARDTQREIVHGLHIGADDYLTKPFDLSELVARLHAVLRRSNGATAPRILRSGTLEIDTNLRQVRRNGNIANLSPREYALLEFLLRNKGVAQDRPTLLEHVWGGRDDLLFSQTVDVHVAYIRRKLGKDVIVTVPGKGYLVADV